MSPTGFSRNWIHSSRGLQGSVQKNNQKSTAQDDEDRIQIENNKNQEDQNLHSLQTSELNDPSNFLGESVQKDCTDHADTRQNDFQTQQKPFEGEHPDTFSLPKDHHKQNTMDMMFPKEKEANGMCRIDQDQSSVPNPASGPISHSTPTFRPDSMNSHTASLASTRSIVDEPLVCNRIPHEDHSYEAMPGRYTNVVPTTATATITPRNHENSDEGRSPRTADPSRRRSLTQSISKLFKKQSE